MHNHVGFESNIKNYLAMGFAHDKSQCIMLKALCKQFNPIRNHLAVNEN